MLLEAIDSLQHDPDFALPGFRKLHVLFGIDDLLIGQVSARAADAGGAHLSGRQNMINALKRIQAAHEPEHTPEKVAAFGISGKRGGIMRLFMTHPPLEERIERLQQATH